jgi:hypothetical protein
LHARLLCTILTSCALSDLAVRLQTVTNSSSHHKQNMETGLPLALQAMNRINSDTTNYKMTRVDCGEPEKIPMRNKKTPMMMMMRRRPNTNNKSRKRVRFHKEDDGTKNNNNNNNNGDNTTNKRVVCCRTAPSLFETLSEEICQRLWFQDSEIAAFRSETRSLILYGKQSEDDDFAGLERFSLERSNRKKTAIQLVLLAQRKGNDASFIQAIATECSEWAVTAGVLQGFQDFCQVYDPLTSLLGANDDDDSAGDTSYNDTLFGTNTSSTSSGSSIGEGLKKRKSRDSDSDSASIQNQDQVVCLPAISADLPSLDRRVQQRII